MTNSQNDSLVTMPTIGRTKKRSQSKPERTGAPRQEEIGGAVGIVDAGLYQALA